MSLCKVTGRVKPDKVSLLSQYVLKLAHPDTILRQFNRGGLLAKESPEALFSLCEQEILPSEVCLLLRQLCGPDSSR